MSETEELRSCPFCGTGTVDVRLGGPAGTRDEDRDRHILAALLLRGQPFGFTWEDVDMLRERVRNCREAERHYSDNFYTDKMREVKRVGDACESLADRIASLLPPRAEP